MDGCPVVHLTDSSYSSDAPIPILCRPRLAYPHGSRVYCPHVLDNSLSHLKTYYTNDLATWQGPDSCTRCTSRLSKSLTRRRSSISYGQQIPRSSSRPHSWSAPSSWSGGTLDVTLDGSCAYNLAAPSIREQTRVTVPGENPLMEARATRAFHLLAAVLYAWCAKQGGRSRWPRSWGCRTRSSHRWATSTHRHPWRTSSGRGFRTGVSSVRAARGRARLRRSQR